MGFLKRLIATSKTHQSAEDLIELVQWNALNSEEELEAIELKSKERPQFLFKNSPRCGVSSMVLRRFERQSNELIDGADFYQIDVIGSRVLSNQIADRYSVIHQSPQLLIIRNGEAVFDDSHYGILDCELASFL